MPIKTLLSELVPHIIQAILEWMWDERGILRYLAVLIGIGLAGFLIWHVAIH